MSDEIVVGIDLGTTFSALAYVNAYGKPEIICNVEGERTTPSVVFIEAEGSWIVGREARNQAIIEPRRTARFFKREMGNPSYRFNVDGKDYFPEDLSAMILGKLKADAERFLNKEVRKAVISVPAYFKDGQREATKNAGRIAGLDVLGIVNEPTAAAIAYGLDKSEGNRTILVYDFGGGTFDVTIMEVKGQEFDIIATDGDAKLGGKDIDGRLVKYLAEEFLREYKVDLRNDPHLHQDLWDKAEKLKKDLSFRDNLSLTLTSAKDTMRIDIDRNKLLELVGDLITQTEECMNRVIAAADMNWSQIDTILLAGGSSRIPAVRNMIKRVTGKETAQDMNPDECVAMGAAIRAATLILEGGEGTSLPNIESAGDIVVHDVASHSLGVKALSKDKSKYINSIIIPRFTQIPAEKTRTYSTSEDNQPQIEIEVLQGEDEDPRSADVQLIGKTGLKDLPKHKAGDLIIEVTLRYDADGVIEVLTRELQSGKMVREVVMTKAGALSEEIIKEKQDLIMQGGSEAE